MTKLASNIIDAQSIRATRQRLRISQSELSRRANISRWKLNTFELGGGDKLNADELNRISDVLRKELVALQQES